jgi:hypothetical protein
LSCKISSQKNSAVIVTPQELKTFEQLKSLGESINKTDEYTNPFDNYLTYTIHESYGTKYAYSNDHEYQVFVGTNGTIEISGYTSPITYEISDGRYQKYITVGNQSTDGIYCRIYNSNGEMVKSGLASTIERTTVNYTAPTADTYTVILSAQITVEFKLENVSKEDLERGIIVNITLNEDLTFFKINTNYQNAEQQTMVAYKGIFSYQGDNAYFYYKDGVGFDCKIKNVRFKITDKGILIDGLPNKSDNLEKGMLYNNNGTLMIV